jgi:hypothetical protein
MFISGRYRDIRNHESLNQTRTGIIVCTAITTIKTLRDLFIIKRWAQVFTGNLTRMKIVGLENTIGAGRKAKWSRKHVLPNVMSLEMSLDHLYGNEKVDLKTHYVCLFRDAFEPG